MPAVTFEKGMRLIDLTGRAHRLAALGVTAGAVVQMLQTYPVIVFECDQTELAIERAVAKPYLSTRSERTAGPITRARGVSLRAKLSRPEARSRLVDRGKVLAVLAKRFPHAAGEDTAAAGSAIVGLEESGKRSPIVRTSLVITTRRRAVRSRSRWNAATRSGCSAVAGHAAP
jgi:hypothetical protein